MSWVGGRGSEQKGMECGMLRFTDMVLPWRQGLLGTVFSLAQKLPPNQMFASSL